LICEKLLTEPDGVMSAIRIFNRIDLPPSSVFEAMLLLMLANVEPVATPDHRILMRLETSSAEIMGQQQFAVTSPLAAGESFSLVLPFRFQAPERETTFWLRFAYDTDDQELTRLPIQLRGPPQITG
jgi:hypothetical protein